MSNDDVISHDVTPRTVVPTTPRAEAAETTPQPADSDELVDPALDDPQSALGALRGLMNIC
jgi:hypothetical protein